MTMKLAGDEHPIPFISKAEGARFAILARWAYARAALLVTEPEVQRRFAWSVLVGALIGTGGTVLDELLPHPAKHPEEASIDALMKALAYCLSSAFLDGPPPSMFAGDDASEAWEEVLSRFIVNSVRANVVILDRGRYDELVKGRRK